MKKIITLLLLFVTVFVFNGCSSDDDYILGVLAESEFDEDRKLIIDYIEKGEDVSYENVILFSLEVGLQRDRLLNR